MAISVCRLHPSARSSTCRPEGDLQQAECPALIPWESQTPGPMSLSQTEAEVRLLPILRQCSVFVAGRYSPRPHFFWLASELFPLSPVLVCARRILGLLER